MPYMVPNSWTFFLPFSLTFAFVILAGEDVWNEEVLSARPLNKVQQSVPVVDSASVCTPGFPFSLAL